MSPYERSYYQEINGTSYNAQARETILGNAALGGYKAKDGSVYTLDGEGNFNRTVTNTVSYGSSFYSGGTYSNTDVEFIGNINRYHEQ